MLEPGSGRSSRSPIARRLLALTSAVGLLVAAGVERAAAQGFGLGQEGGGAPRRYVLTISGGISLGAYEAGLNWAVVRYLKKHRPRAGATPGTGAQAELVGVTGASAGNINALLSAIAWCQRDEIDQQERPETSLFWDAWTKVGLEHLFPGPAAEGAYAPDDGIFTRRAFTRIEDTIVRTLSDPTRFIPGCHLPVGVTVTRNRLAALELKDSRDPGPGMRIDTQRFVVTVEARASERGLEIHERPGACEDPSVGQYLRFSPGGNGLIPPRQVLDIVEASSAFPLAFGPKTLRHHEPVSLSRFGGCPSLGRSPDGTCLEPFFDGGVFDNVPLGLGVSLALPPDPGTCTPAGNGGDLEFVYVDPGRRRHGALTPAGEERATGTTGQSRRGLASAKAFAQNFVTVSRQYELQSAARYVFDRLFQRKEENGTYTAGAGAPTPANERPVARLRLSSRFHPLVAEHLGAFAGFFARSFREHDFFVGVYDAVIGIAETGCPEATAPATPALDGARRWSADRARCIARSAAEVVADLGLSRSPGAQSLLARQLAAEVEGTVSKAAEATDVLGSVRLGPHTLASWRQQRAPDHALGAAVFDTLAAETRRERDARRAGPAAVAELDEQNAFVRFVEAYRERLQREGLRTQASAEMSAEERRFVAAPAEELQGFLADVLERQRQVEDEDDYATGERLMAGAQMLLHSEPLRPHAGLDLDPSSVPDRRLTPWRGVAHALPFHVSGDFNHRGLSLGWRPGYWFGDLGVGVPLSLLNWEIPAGKMYATVGLSGLYHLDSFFLPEIELGGRVTSWYYPWPESFGAERLKPGAELVGYFFAGKLRLAIGVLDARRAGSIDTWTFKAGVSDANGLLYWMAQFLGF